MLTLFHPNFLIDSVVELTPDRLKSLGVKRLLLDVDCTLKQYANQEPEPGILEWLAELKSYNIDACLLSNGVPKRIERFAALVGLPFIAKACKPFPSGCKRACREWGCEPSSVMVVGDQIFADVLAGKLAGIRTVLVKPIHPEQEHWFTKIKRPFEKVVLRSFVRECPAGVWIPTTAPRG